MGTVPRDKLNILAEVRMMTDMPQTNSYRPAGRTVPFSAGSARKSGERTYIKAGKMILLGGAAFLLSRASILGGLYPFAPAFMAAVLVSYPRKGAAFFLPAALGLYTVLSGRLFLVYAAVTALLAIIFLLYTVDEKKRWFVVPGMVVAAMMTGKGLMMALTVYTDYQLLVSVFESAIAGGLSLVFMVILTALHRFDVARRFSADEIVCIFLAVTGILCGVNDLQIGFLDVQGLLSRLLILLAAYLGGPGAGASVGALTGVAPSIAQVVAPSVIAAYTFSGLLAGVFSGFGRIGTVIGFILGNMILALYVATPADVTAGLLTSGIAALLFFTIPLRLSKPLGKAFSFRGLRSAKEEKNGRLLQLAVSRLRRFGWLFRDIGFSLEELARPQVPDETESVRVSMEQLSHQLCSGCSLRDVCWELDRKQTFLGVRELFRQVEEKGTAQEKDAPENFAKRCPHLKELIAMVNCLYDLQCRNNYWQREKASSSRLLSASLSGVAEMMEKVTREISEYGDERELLDRELGSAIAKRGLPVEAAGVSSLSERAVNIWVQFSDCPGEPYCRQAVEEEVGRLLGASFRVHEAGCGSAEQGGPCRCEYRLLAAGAHAVSLGKAQLSRDKGGICGDSGDSILLEDGRELLIISDGMGCGEEAAAESGAAVELIRKLLAAGFSQDTAIDILNSVLALRGSVERFVTLDICVVDKYEGRVDFIKTGGAASYIKRGGTVKTVGGAGLPVGMLGSVEEDVTSDQILPGDMIIMASDGLLDMDTQGEGQWLSRIIGQAVVNDPQVMAEYLLDKVVTISGGRLKDDITVLVAKMGDIA